jgi:hypothetical protein
VVCYVLEVAFLIGLDLLRDGSKRLATGSVVSLLFQLLCWRKEVRETKSRGYEVLDETLSVMDRIGSRDGIAHAVYCACAVNGSFSVHEALAMLAGSCRHSEIPRCQVMKKTLASRASVHLL